MSDSGKPVTGPEREALVLVYAGRITAAAGDLAPFVLSLERRGLIRWRDGGGWRITTAGMNELHAHRPAAGGSTIGASPAEDRGANTSHLHLAPYGYQLCRDPLCGRPHADLADDMECTDPACEGGCAAARHNAERRRDLGQ